MSSGMADRGFPPPFGLLLAALELPCHSYVDALENAMKLFSFSIAVSALTSVAVCGAASRTHNAASARQSRQLD
jgi:hypothetical protein